MGIDKTTGGFSLGSYAGVNTAAANSLIIPGSIGIGPPSPSYALDIASSGAGTKDIARLGNTQAAANNTAAELLFAANRTTVASPMSPVSPGMITDITNGAYKGALIFSTANNASPAERMRIDSSGNVGIGTTSPTSLLFVSRSDGDPGTGNGTVAISSYAMPITAANNIDTQALRGQMRPECICWFHQSELHHRH